MKLYPEYVLLSSHPLSKIFYFNHLRNLSFSFSFLGNLIKSTASATVYHTIMPRLLSGPQISPKLQVCTFGHLPNFSAKELYTSTSTSTCLQLRWHFLDHVQPRVAVNAAQQRITNLLREFWKFVVLNCVDLSMNFVDDTIVLSKVEHTGPVSASGSVNISPEQTPHMMLI